MKALGREDLWSLEEYAQQRAAFRDKVIAHKRDREVTLNEHARLLFEDELTIRYQIQEMLRIEKIFEAEGIQDELDAYNPLIPDGGNWKATFMIEYDDVAERKEKLAGLLGVEDRIWMQVKECDKVYALADEDMDRENEEKTSSVHFLRFELSDEMIRAVKQGAGVTAGCDHPNMPIEGVRLDKVTVQSLGGDLE